VKPGFRRATSRAVREGPPLLLVMTLWWSNVVLLTQRTASGRAPSEILRNDPIDEIPRPVEIGYGLHGWAFFFQLRKDVCLNWKLLPSSPVFLPSLFFPPSFFSLSQPLFGMSLPLFDPPSN